MRLWLKVSDSPQLPACPLSPPWSTSLLLWGLSSALTFAGPWTPCWPLGVKTRSGFSGPLWLPCSWLLDMLQQRGTSDISALQRGRVWLWMGLGQAAPESRAEAGRLFHQPQKESHQHEVLGASPGRS